MILGVSEDGLFYITDPWFLGDYDITGDILADSMHNAMIKAYDKLPLSKQNKIGVIFDQIDERHGRSMGDADGT